MKDKSRSVATLAARICRAFDRHGLSAVLTGGSCVAIYSAGRYVSKDLDFVLAHTSDIKAARVALAEIGFQPQGRFFISTDTNYYVDLLPPPLSVGSEPVKEVATMRAGRCVLRLLSPTDCVKDRLASFYFWDDRQALEQALLVAERQKIALNEVRRWSRLEGMLPKFMAFSRAIARRRTRETKPARRSAQATSRA
jgi:hypothetical protein